MAIAKLANGIDEFHGAVDSIKEGKKNRMHLICRWRPQGPQSYAPDGSKLHELFFMRFPEGPRSEGYQRNYKKIRYRFLTHPHRLCRHPLSLSCSPTWLTSASGFLPSVFSRR